MTESKATDKEREALPELPAPRRHGGTYESSPFDFFTADQMREYACEAVRAALSSRDEATADAVLTDAYADGRRDEQQELASVLPGVLYMDLPDGGAPTVLEQLQRQAKDAARYVWLRAGNYPIAFARCVLNDTPHGIDSSIDDAIASQRTSTEGKV